MQKAIAVSEEKILNKIYLIRGKKVMLDRDLAILYGVRSIRLREQVKRNAERFPPNFIFQLTKDEVDFMVSQNAIPSKQHLGGYLPYAFTEHGVLMLSNVLKGYTAIEVSVRIVEVFVKMREMLSTHKDILLKLDQLEKRTDKHDREMQAVFAALKELINPPTPPMKKIGFRISKK
jgi:phage regulator Rha-like protein